MDRGAWRATVYGVAWAGHYWATKHTAHYKNPENVSYTRFLSTMLPWDQLVSFLQSSFYWNWYFQASVDLHLVNQKVNSQYTSYVIFSSIWLITNSFLKYHLHAASCFGCEGTFVFTFVLVFPDHTGYAFLVCFNGSQSQILILKRPHLLNIWFHERHSRVHNCLLFLVFEFPSVTCNSSLFRLTLICPRALNPSHAVSHFCGDNSIPSNINT